MRGGPPPKDTAQWCEAEKPAANIPHTDRTYEGALAFAGPSHHGVRPVGPQIEWYPDGGVKSHGSFALDERGASVAHGMWTFWYPHGQRHVQGRYHLGTPVGCFARWSEDGAVETMIAEGERFRITDCPVPPAPEASRLEDRYAPGAGARPLGRERFSASLGGFVGSGDPTIEASEVEVPSSAVGLGARATLRRRVGPVKVGAAVVFEGAGGHGTLSASFGPLASVSIPTSPDWLDVEVSASLGPRIYSVHGRFAANRVHRELFVGSYGRAEAALGVRLTAGLGVYLTAFTQGDIGRSTRRVSTWCGLMNNFPGCWNVASDWKIRGISYGGALELRFLVR